ncbi:hypothetical protein V8E52_005076 [Russula decolorans]
MPQARTTDAHSTYTLLSAVIRKYPHIASVAFRHIAIFFSQWSDLEVVDLPKCGSYFD